MSVESLPGVNPLTVYRLGGELLVYRCVLSDDPDDEAFVKSFKSNYERGSRPRKIEAEFAPAHMGLSMWLDRERAAEIGRTYPDTAGAFTRRSRSPRAWA